MSTCNLTDEGLLRLLKQRTKLNLKGKKATLERIADKSNLSKNTVSRVLAQSTTKLVSLSSIFVGLELEVTKSDYTLDTNQERTTKGILIKMDAREQFRQRYNLASTPEEKQAVIDEANRLIEHEVAEIKEEIAEWQENVDKTKD